MNPCPFCPFSKACSVGKKHKKVVLVGTPNAGKSRLLSQISNVPVHVGNWPGTTYEELWGTFIDAKGNLWRIADTPGIYSTEGEEWRVVENAVKEADAVIFVIDGLSPKRSKALLQKIKERVRKPIITVITKGDLVKAQGIVFPGEEGRRKLAEALAQLSLGKPAEISFTVKTKGAKTHREWDKWLLYNKLTAYPALFSVLFGTLFLVLFLNSLITGPILEAVGHINLGPLGTPVLLGVSNVVAFAPLVFLMLSAFFFLEELGYLPRMNVLLYPILRKLGLPSHATFPLFMAMGCNVPAVHSLKIKRNGDALALALPFVPCSSRWAVFAFLASLTMGSLTGALALLYLLILSALAVGLTSALFSKQKEDLILELPPYLMPSLEIVLGRAWHHTVEFLKSAGTWIFLFSVAFYALSHYPQDKPVLESLTEGLTGIFKPLGFTWKEISVLLSGFLAKELVISSFYTVGIDPTAWEMEKLMTFLVFLFLYTPCLSTLAALAEVKGWKLSLLSVVWSLSLAYAFALLTRLLLGAFGL